MTRDQLKNIVEGTIKTNGNQQITGENLQETLKTILDNVPSSDEVVSGISGIAQPNDIIPATGFFQKIADTAQTYTNYKDSGNAAIVVTAADLDVVNGVQGNEVILAVTDGVAKKRVYKKGEGLDAYETAVKNGFVGTYAEWVATLSVTNITNNYTVDPDQIVPSEALYNSGALAGDITKRISEHSKNEVTYKEVTVNENGVAISDADLDDTRFFIKVGSKYYQQITNKIINVQDFGLLPGQNCGAKFNRLLQLFKNKGATFYFPTNDLEYIFEEQIIIPYSVINNTPTQKPFKLIGDGSYWNGKAIGANGKKGSCIQLAYNGNGSYLDAKIISYGLGSLTIEDLTFEDLSGDNTPFFYGTYTTWKVSRNAFLGSKIGTACDQDVFVLGGTATSEIGDVPNGGFQGYGTIISENYFNGIRRGVLGQNYFNANIIRDNTFWFQCGNVNGGAIEFDGSNSIQACTGNLVTGNLCEMKNYAHFFKGKQASSNTFLSNNLFDTNVTTISYYDFDSTSVYNFIITGWNMNTKPTLSGEVNKQTVLTSQQGQSSFMEKFSANSMNIISDNTTYTRRTVAKIKDSNVGFYDIYSGSQKTYQIVRVNQDESLETMLSIRDYNDGIWGYTFLGSDPRLISTGSMRIRTGTDKELFLGTTGKEITILKGGIIFKAQTSSALPHLTLFVDAANGSLTFKNGSGVDLPLDKPKALSTSSRPSATSAGAGASIYDTTIGKPIWSDGSVWKDATGTVV